RIVLLDRRREHHLEREWMPVERRGRRIEIRAERKLAQRVAEHPLRLEDRLTAARYDREEADVAVVAHDPPHAEARHAERRAALDRRAIRLTRIVELLLGRGQREVLAVERLRARDIR